MLITVKEERNLGALHKLGPMAGLINGMDASMRELELVMRGLSDDQLMVAFKKMQESQELFKSRLFKMYQDNFLEVRKGLIRGGADGKG